MLAYGGFAPVAGTEAKTAPFVRVAADLRGLPRENFKATLKAELIRRATMPQGAASSAAVKQEFQNTAVPYLCAKNAAAAIDFYKKAFGATESFERMISPDGRVGHAEFRIGEATLMISDEYPEINVLSPETLGATPVMIVLTVENADAVVEQAVAAGAKVLLPVEDQPYGRRSGKILDPFGFRWDVGTPIRSAAQPERNREESRRPGMESKARRAETPKTVNYIREGFRAVSPYILVGGAAKFIEFMKEAFGAEERGRVPMPNGKIMHAEVRLGDSTIEMSDGNEQYGPSPVTIHLTVPDAEGAYRRALKAGATSLYEPATQFWGENESGVRDPFGNEWYITSPSEEYPQPTVQPYLHLHDAEKIIPFLEAAFGAKATGVHKWPGGVIAHATVLIGDGQIEIDEAFRANRQTQCHLHLYVPDTDAVYAQALRAGATSIEVPNDKPYGDRSAGVKDAWGNSWFIATHIKDVAF